MLLTGNEAGRSLQTPIVWSAPMVDRSGIAEEARNFILGLDERGWPVLSDAFLWSDWTVRLASGAAERIEHLAVLRPPKRFVHVVHGRPMDVTRHPAAVAGVGRTMFETEGTPPGVDALAEMDEIWVPSQFNLDSFARAGVEPKKLAKVAEPLDDSLYQQNVRPLSLPGLESGYMFLSSFAWQLRKGWDVLVRAYLEEFSRSEDVALAIKVEPFLPQVATLADARSQLEGFIRTQLGLTPEDSAKIVLLDLDLSDVEMPRLYRSADAFVLASRGEGWGRPYMEAMAMGLPTIGTRATGNLEFMNEENSYLVDCEPKAVPTEGWMEVAAYRDHDWAEPSVPDLRTAMRRVFEERSESRERGKRARVSIIDQYRRKRVASQVAERLGLDPKPPTTLPARVPLVWEGDFFTEHSLAVVNRSLCRALLGTGRVDLSVRTDLTSETVRGHPSWTGLISRVDQEIGGGPRFHIRQTWPPKLTLPSSDSRLILYQPWEFGSPPQAWLDGLEAGVEEFWVPTNHVRDGLLGAGADPDRVYLVPNGVDPLRFNPGVPPMELSTDKSFRFLFVGGTLFRKGVDILLESYLRIFGPDDDVCLVIKDFGTDTFYRGQGMAEQIRALASDRQAPEILYFDEEWPDRAMPHLYAAADCLVAPYRAEGFCLPIAEAMAVGLPVIATGYGACLDYCDEEVAHLLSVTKVTTTEPRLANIHTVEPPHWAEPNRRDLDEAMLRQFEDRTAGRLLGERAAERIREQYTWKHAAERLVDRLQEIEPRQKPRGTLSEVKQGRRHSLSVCLVVRDEEEHIAEVLKSVRGLADQVVVADTGSIDRTARIAEDMGAEVHHLEPSAGFGAWRTAALRRADGDWVLVLDADERLDPASQDELRRIVKSDDLVGYLVRIINYTDRVGEDSYLEHRTLRLFPNHPDLSYEGSDPHAQLRWQSEDVPFELRPAEIVVHHEGYRPQYLEDGTKLKRNLDALQKAVTEDPDNAFHAFNLGLTLTLLGRAEEAERELQRSVALAAVTIQSGHPPLFLANAYLSLALVVFAQQRFSEAASHCESAIRLAPGFADAYLTLGSSLIRLGRYTEALEAFRSAIGSDVHTALAASDHAASTWKPLIGMAEAHAAMQHQEEANACLALAHEIAPESPEVAIGVARASIDAGELEAAEEIIGAVIARGDAPPDVWLISADLAMIQGDAEGARELLTEGMKRHPLYSQTYQDRMSQLD